MIIFVHIPKTAGTSLIRNVLRKQITKNDRDFTVKKEFKHYLFGDKTFKEKPHVISGHFPFGVHKCFDVEHYSYFTFLRNPVQRWISHFLYSLEGSDNDIIKNTYNSHDGDFLSFLDKCESLEIVCNIMTKQLSGLEHPNNLFLRKKHRVSGCYYVPSACSAKNKYDDDEMNHFLDVARSNLESCDFVGFQENYDKDVKRFCGIYGLEYPKENVRYRKRNIVDTKFVKLFSKSDVLLKIQEINKYDMDLYDYAKNKYR